ncbi:MAG: hypothetical protein ACLRXQ_04415 [Phascolarctobacterium faecium]
MDAKTSYFVVVAAAGSILPVWLPPTFAILAGPMSQTMGWTGAQVVRLFADDEHLCHYSIL